MHDQSTPAPTTALLSPSRVTWAHKAAGALLFAALTALGATLWIPLPFTPVPITLEVFFVLLAGATLGAGFGAASQVGFLGILALKGGTLAFLVGPTGGYLLGFVLAPIVMGALLRRRDGARPGLVRLGLAMVAGLGVIYAAGTIYLSLLTGADLGTAALLGVVPFLAVDAVKLALAFSIARPAAKLFQR